MMEKRSRFARPILAPQIYGMDASEATRDPFGRGVAENARPNLELPVTRYGAPRTGNPFTPRIYREG